MTTYYDLTAEYQFRNAFDGKVGMITPRLSLFEADSWNYIYTQSNTIGATTLLQTLNIDKVNFHGIEGVLSMKDVYWHGLGFMTSATFTDSKILADSLAPWFIGNQVPRIPRIRLHGTISYAPNDTFSVAATMRFAKGSFVSLANTDFSHDSYGSMHSLDGSARNSRWSRYTEMACHYAHADHDAKQVFVRGALDSIQPAHVLDVGANTGVYSRIAAESGAAVVAWDTDVQASEINWQAARKAGLSILPLVADFARPTPAAGWRNRECASLLDRAKGQFDCVMMLGILHHLLVADQIPLPAILEQLAEISSRWAIVEWIPKGDSQFESLCRGRHELYGHLSEEYFLRTLALRFTVRERNLLANGRSLWLLERI